MQERNLHPRHTLRTTIYPTDAKEQNQPSVGRTKTNPVGSSTSESISTVGPHWTRSVFYQNRLMVLKCCHSFHSAHSGSVQSCESLHQHIDEQDLIVESNIRLSAAPTATLSCWQSLREKEAHNKARLTSLSRRLTGSSFSGVKLTGFFFFWHNNTFEDVTLSPTMNLFNHFLVIFLWRQNANNLNI